MAQIHVPAECPRAWPHVATNAWIVLTQWFTHRQVVDRRRTIQSADIHEGIRHFVALFSPLLLPAQRRQVQRVLAKTAD